jgi:endonuclease YncB( thermonuclease family)
MVRTSGTYTQEANIQILDKSHVTNVCTHCGAVGVEPPLFSCIIKTGGDSMTTRKPISGVKPKFDRVIDGDTIAFIFNCRLNRIDTPETKGIERQLGQVAKNYVIERMNNARDIRIDIIDRDYYGRLLIELYIDGVNINDELVEKRLAEYYKPKNHNNGVLDI